MCVTSRFPDKDSFGLDIDDSVTNSRMTHVECIPLYIYIYIYIYIFLMYFQWLVFLMHEVATLFV